MQYATLLAEHKHLTKVLKIGINDTYGESGPAVELVKEIRTGCRQHLRKSKSICIRKNMT